MQASGQNFIEVVKQLFSAPSNEERAKNEAILSQYMREQSDAFAEDSVREFQNASLPASVRVIVSTVLRLALRPVDREKGVSIWLALAPATRDKIKLTSLACLIDGNEQVRRASANLAAVAFVLDITTERSWGTLLPALTENIGNSNPDIKRSAITTLGYICELLNTDKITDLPKQQIDTLLSGICLGLTGFSEISNTAVLALSNSIQFLSTTIQDEAMADYIFDLLLNLLIKAGEARDEEVQRNLILCLGEIVKMMFAGFEKYHSITFQKVIECYRSGFDSVTLAVNEFFMLMIKLEGKHKTKYLQAHWKLLFQASLELLFAVNQRSASDDESGLSLAASFQMLITAVNGLYMEECFPQTMVFVTQHIENPDEAAKLTALMAFSSILENTPNSMAAVPLSSGFFSLLNYVRTGTPLIRLTALRLLRKAAQNHTNVFLNDHNFPRAYDEMIRIIDSKTGDEDFLITIKAEACGCFEACADFSDTVTGGKQLLLPYGENIFDILLKNVQTITNYYLADVYFSTMFSFLQKIIEPTSLPDYFSVFSDFLVGIVQNYSGPCKKQILESLFITQNVILTQLNRFRINLKIKNKDSRAFLLELYNFVKNVFAQFKEIFSEGLVLMAAILIYDPSYFKDNVEEFITTYIASGLRDPNNYDLFKTAVESVSLIIKNFPNQYESYFKDYIPYFLDLLENNSLQKELKVVLFYVVSDLALHSPQLARDHIERILRLAEMAFVAIVHLQSTGVQESIEFSDALKEILIDCYLCMVHGVYMTADNQYKDKDVAFETSFVKLIDFIRLTSQPQLNPTIDYLKNCLTLIVDFYTKNKNPQLINLEVVRNLYKTLSNYSTYSDVSSMLDYARNNIYGL